MILPALRHLDVMPVEQNGQNFFSISDPEGYVEEQFALSGAAFFIAACLDGSNSIEDIRGAFQEQLGAAVATEEISKVVEFLDNAGLLHSEKFFAIKDETCRRFCALETRPAWLAGKSYPADAAELRAYLSQMLDAREPQTQPADSGPIGCLIAPHIDFQRGCAAYAAAYQAAQTAKTKPRLIIIFGVAHSGAETPFILTRKHFQTPLGTLQTDVDVVDRLAEVCAWDALESEIVHRTEHSIEFQAVMLAHILGPQMAGARIVPILCGPFGAPDAETAPEDPAHVAGVAEFLAECRAIAQARDALVIAAADLSHVGRRFGDDFDIEEAVVEAVEKRDIEDLAFALKGDAKGFYSSVMQDSNARKVCGLGCIYAALSTAGAAGKGRLLHYGHAQDPAGGIVSFASIALPR